MLYTSQHVKPIGFWGRDLGREKISGLVWSFLTVAFKVTKNLTEISIPWLEGWTWSVR